MRLNKIQRNLLANGFRDLANLSILGLIFSYVTAIRWERYFFVAGIFLYIGLNFWALYLTRGGDS